MGSTLPFYRTFRTSEIAVLPKKKKKKEQMVESREIASFFLFFELVEILYFVLIF